MDWHCTLSAILFGGCSTKAGKNIMANPQYISCLPHFHKDKSLNVVEGTKL